MRKFLPVLAIALMGLALFCTEADYNPLVATRGDLFTVMVVDTNGDPAAGIAVGSINHPKVPIYFSTSKLMPPGTEIVISLPTACDYRLDITDYYGDSVQTFTGSESAGAMTLIWNSANAISGYYYYSLWARSVDDANSVFTEEKAVVIEHGPDPIATIIGETNAYGIFSTNDTLFFPGLLGNQPDITVTDEGGHPLGVHTFYIDTVSITLSDPPGSPPVSYFVRKLNTRRNQFVLIWNPSND